MSTAILAPRRLGSLLIEKGYITPDGLQSALEKQKEEGKGKLLGELLVELQYCSEDQIVECLAVEYGVPYAKLEARLFDAKIVDLLPREYIEKNLVLPMFMIRGVLTVAVSEPSNLFLIDEIRGMTNAQVLIVAASTKDIRRMITSLPNSKVFVIDDIIEDSESTNVTLIEEVIEDIGEIDEDAVGQNPIIRLVNYIIFNAVKDGASDIHIEPSEHCMRVRYRIDGKLHKALEVPLHLFERRNQPHQDHGLHGHQRAAAAAGRPRARAFGRPQDRPPREHFSLHARRKNRHPRARHPQRFAEPRRPGIRRGHSQSFPAKHPRTKRHHPRYRADRKRQIHHSLRRAERDQLHGEQRLHG